VPVQPVGSGPGLTSVADRKVNRPRHGEECLEDVAGRCFGRLRKHQSTMTATLVADRSPYRDLLRNRLKLSGAESLADYRPRGSAGAGAEA
jgi:hypothetical protein